MIQYAERVFNITEGTDDEKINGAIKETVNFFKRLEMPTTITEVGVKEDDIDFLVEQLEKHGKVNMSERRDQNGDTHRIIYKEALTNDFLS